MLPIDDTTAWFARQPGSSASEVKAEQIRTLYRQSVGIGLVNSLNALIVALVLWPSENPPLLVGWVMAMIAATTGRTVLRSRYHRAFPPPEKTTLWARRFVLGAVSTGSLWGLAGVLFYDAGDPIAQLLLIFVIGGMVAGASGTLAFHLPAFMGFAAGAVVPTAARLMFEGGRLHVAMGALAIIYGIAMTMLAFNTHRALTEEFRLRFENQGLLRRLSRAQFSLAEANRTLERRVAERGAELERQAEALRDAQRMESVGLLAGGIAHDFNNLLTIVMGNTELLYGVRSLSVADMNSLEHIRSAAKRGASLVSQLLAFSRRQVMVRRVLDLNGVVSEAERLLVPLIGEHIQLTVVKHASPLFVKADATQLQQVIINLATNARDAMLSGGKLTIETNVSEEGIPADAIPTGRYAVLSVRDTGIGMEAETRRMVFHPFFTTKEVGRGTGLGLATVYGIVEQTGGYIIVESELGKGSCFRVYLPISTEKAEADAPTIVISPAGVRHAGTVLIAEDDNAIRELAGRVLIGAGFEVIEAENGQQALEAARRHKGAIDLLITDMVMPNLGGLELAKILIRERPAIRTLVVSGYNPEKIPESDRNPQTFRYLAKPFTPEELLTHIGQLFSSKAALGHPQQHTSAGHIKY